VAGGNEGNGRLSTTIPRVHIAMMGMEKWWRNWRTCALASLLTCSATGQAITTYFNLISGPRRTGEKDGPQKCIWPCWITAVRKPMPMRNCAARCSVSVAVVA
jgi:L-lactate utilization protein LutB